MTDQSVHPSAREVEIDAPDQREGIVLKWRRRGDWFEGLVTHEVDGKIVTEWLPALELKPRLEDV